MKNFLEKENQAKQEQAIVERTSSMNDEALKELMYERLSVSMSRTIRILKSFGSSMICLQQHNKEPV